MNSDIACLIAFMCTAAAGFASGQACQAQPTNAQT